MDATLTVDTSPFSQLDKRFLHVLFASMCLHAFIAVWVARQPHVVSDESYETAAVDRFLKAPLLPIPKVFPPVKVAQPPGPPSRRPSGNGGNRPGPALPGLLAGALDDLAKDRSDVGAALDGARRGNVDTTLLASRRERGPNEAEAIGPVTTDGVRDVGIGTHVDRPARGLVDPVVLDDPQLPDPALYLRFINQHRAALAACYERELKYNRSLRGKLTVHLTVSGDGRAREVTVDDDSLQSSAVAECIQSAVRRWVFPRAEDDVPLQFPVLFTPAR